MLYLAVPWFTIVRRFELPRYGETMKNLPPSATETLKRLSLMIYLVPIFGAVPALYQLWRHQGSREEEAVYRLVVTLALGWLMAYGLLSAGSQLVPGLSIRLLVANTLVTTGYTLTNLGLMVRLLQGRSLKLAGFSRLSRRLP